MQNVNVVFFSVIIAKTISSLPKYLTYVNLFQIKVQKLGPIKILTVGLLNWSVLGIGDSFPRQTSGKLSGKIKIRGYSHLYIFNIL